MVAIQLDTVDVFARRIEPQVTTLALKMKTELSPQ